MPTAAATFSRAMFGAVWVSCQFSARPVQPTGAFSTQSWPRQSPPESTIPALGVPKDGSGRDRRFCAPFVGASHVWRDCGARPGHSSALPARRVFARFIAALATGPVGS